MPLAVDHRQRAADGLRRWRAEALVARLDLLAHVGDVEVGDDARVGEQRRRGVGIVGVDVDLERRLVADDQHRVAEPLELGDEAALLEPGAGDGEVRAVAEGGRGVLGMGHARRGVVLERGRLAAAQRADDPGEQHGEPRSRRRRRRPPRAAPAAGPVRA